MGQETQITTPKQMSQIQLLPFFDDNLHSENLTDQWVPARGIDDQKIMQSDWTRGITGYSQLKLVASFPRGYIHAKNLRD